MWQKKYHVHLAEDGVQLPLKAQPRMRALGVHPADSCYGQSDPGHHNSLPVWLSFMFLPRVFVAGRTIAPTDVHIPNPQNLWMCYLTWKRVFTDVVELKALRWRDDPGLSGQGSLYKGGRRGSQRRPDSGSRGRPKWCRCPQTLERQGSDSPPEPREEHSPADTPILAQ